MTILYLASSVKGISCWCPFFASDEGNQALQEFLISCNPKQQHSTALESYLIKPIQRILKYPLLLTQLKVRNHQINAGGTFLKPGKRMRDLKFNLSVVSLSLSLCVSAFKSFQSKFDIFSGSHFSPQSIFSFSSLPFLEWEQMLDVGVTDFWLSELSKV